ncbi:negative elongation factor A isoform X1 [Lampetra fluviatilis]
MASVRESDTSLWLHNKLGSPDELWTPSSIVSLLTKDVIRNIQECFHALSSPVKLKLLLGVLHLPRRTVDEMKSALGIILTLARSDPDLWVQMIADVVRTFPDSGTLNLELEEQNSNAQSVLGDLKEKVVDCDASTMLPLECQFLNKSALTTLVGPLAPPAKHFQLRRKPKSATLRAELLQKSTETAQQLKKTSGIPFHAKGRGLVKKIDTTTPLKGIPKQAPFRSPSASPGFGSPGTRTPLSARTPLRKERGVKLLDISELDAVGAGREAKRRKKAPEAEQGEKAAKDEAAVNPVTPDYAAGLVSTPKLGALSNDSSMPSTSYLPATPSMIPSSSYNPSADAPSGASGAAAIRDALQSNRTPEEPPSSPTVPMVQNPFKQQAPLYSSALPSSATAPAASPSPTTPQPTTPTLTQAPASQQQPVPVPQPPAATAAFAATATVAQQQQTQQTQQSQPKKNLSLTREQMYAAQEMFKTANKVTRPEKALILGFMAGSRENPCPDQGDIIQIKLSEHTEVLPKADGTGSTTMLVDTVFEMNYATGQWTRLKKYKPITNTS